MLNATLQRIPLDRKWADIYVTLEKQEDISCYIFHYLVDYRHVVIYKTSYPITLILAKGLADDKTSTPLL